MNATHRSLEYEQENLKAMCTGKLVFCCHFDGIYWRLSWFVASLSFLNPGLPVYRSLVS